MFLEVAKLKLLAGSDIPVVLIQVSKNISSDFQLERGCYPGSAN